MGHAATIPTDAELTRAIAPRPSGAAPGPPRLGAMISGGGRTILNLLDAIGRGDLHAAIPVAIASRGCPGVERLRARGVEVRVMPGDLDERELCALVAEFGLSWIVLGGYLRRVPVPAGLGGRIVNIHPALLPAFGGPGMFGDRVHAAVLASGARESGCTVHLCDDEYDRGPIVLQRRCPVESGDTVDTLAARVFERECIAYPEALQRLFALPVSGMSPPEEFPA